jgi:hypothetical protein
VVTPCGHAFHRECLVPWLGLKPNCPNCRSHLGVMRRQLQV